MKTVIIEMAKILERFAPVMAQFVREEATKVGIDLDRPAKIHELANNQGFLIQQDDEPEKELAIKPIWED